MRQDLDVSALLQPELMAGESLLWSGRPRQGIAFYRSDLFLIPFSILWTGFAVFWIYGATASGAPASFWSFGLIFVAVGLYFVFGRFLTDALDRGRTYYGVTSDRIIIVNGFFGRRVKSLNLRTLTDVTFTSATGGKGIISFGAMNSPFSAFGGASWPGMGRYQPPSFILDADIQQVYAIIRDAQKRAH
jgi:hypothetical protein